MTSTLTAAKASLLSLTVRHETRYASSPVGSGARESGHWSVSPIVAVTRRTIVIEFHSGRRQSIKLDTGLGGRGGDVVTAMHPEDLERVRAALQ